MENTQTMDMGLLANKMRQIKSPRRHDPIGEPEGVISNPNQFDPTYHSDYVMICKEIADILTKRYPGWLWAVKPNQTGRVIDVFCMQLHDAYGYTIRMVDILHDPRRKQAYAAGHEILRRFGMPDRLHVDRLTEAPRDAAGRCIPDISDFKSKKEKRNAEIARKLATGEWSIVEREGHRYLRKNR